jgi:hypothetical protein
MDSPRLQPSRQAGVKADVGVPGLSGYSLPPGQVMKLV